MNTKNENVVKYEALVNSVEYHRVMMENAQASARLILASLQEQIGSEPFEVNGELRRILVRRGVLQTTPIQHKPHAKREKKSEELPCEGIGQDTIGA